MEFTKFFTGHGGARKGAGRKAVLVDGKTRVGHRRRGELKERNPLHVTMRLEKGLPTLREWGELDVVRDVLQGVAERVEEFRVVHYCVLSNHLHLLVEVGDGERRSCREALMSGMTSFAVRLARGLNRLWGRTGRVLADRYDAEVLDSPTRVRWALRYVLKNAKKHGARLGRSLLDLFSSEVWFDGFVESLDPEMSRKLHLERKAAEEQVGANPCAAARTWYLKGCGWKRAGKLSVFDSPAHGRGAAARSARSGSPGEPSRQGLPPEAVPV